MTPLEINLRPVPEGSSSGSSTPNDAPEGTASFGAVLSAQRAGTEGDSARSEVTDTQANSSAVDESSAQTPTDSELTAPGTEAVANLPWPLFIPTTNNATPTQTIAIDMNNTSLGSADDALSDAASIAKTTASNVLNTDIALASLPSASLKWTTNGQRSTPMTDKSATDTASDLPMRSTWPLAADKTAASVEKAVVLADSSLGLQADAERMARATDDVAVTMPLTQVSTAATHVLSPNSHTTSVNTATVTQTWLPTPMHSPAWGEHMVQQIKQFALERIGVAELRLNPQELGPIRVEIALDQQQAAIHFSAQQAETRDALTQQLPRLREVLAEAGLQLQNATTGSFSDGQAFAFMQQQARERRQESRGDNSVSNATDLAAVSSPTALGVASQRAAARGGVDLFA